MLNELLFGVVVSIIVIFLVPQAWREDNSWWFAIIKFWFFILPLMFCLSGIFLFFVGPIFALRGIFIHDGSEIVTLIYLWITCLILIYQYSNEKFKKLIDEL